MVGDSYGDDVEGALAAGLAGAVLLDRDGPQAAGGASRGPVIGSLGELRSCSGWPEQPGRGLACSGSRSVSGRLALWAPARTACGRRSGTASAGRR